MTSNNHPNLAVRFWRGLMSIGNWRLGSILKVLTIVFIVLVVFTAALLLWVAKYPFAHMPGADPIDRVVYASPGWGSEQVSAKREEYYYTPQGTSIKNLRYSWFVHLQKAWSSDRLAAPENLQALGFIIDKEATQKNPDHLPVGFAKGYEPRIREDVLDVSCAACHTGELHYTRNTGGKPEHIAIRIDGGSAMHAFASNKLGQFLPSLLSSMAATYLNPLKFNAFAHCVLKERYADGKSKLHQDLGEVFWAIAKQGYIDSTRHLYPVEEGLGRTDAIGRISNQVFASSLDQNNYRVADAPVSYPPLWEIWKFDWVQYTASATQPLARNLGESLGVGADPGLVDPYEAPMPKDLRFIASAKVYNLVKLETLLRDLEPPQWPEDVFGVIDPAKAEKGRVLYGKYCASCHQPCELSAETRAVEVPLRPAGDAYWRVQATPLQVIGTDPASTRNFRDVRVNLANSGITNEEARQLVEKNLRERQRRTNEYRKAHNLPLMDSEAEIRQKLAHIDVRSASIGAGLNYLGILMRNRFYADHGISPEEQTRMDGDGALDLPQVVLAYKARPLAGIWATAPFLHNGSVGTLYELLLPADKRRKSFYAGDKEFDPKYVGIPMEQPAKKGFYTDTSIAGNLNIGHEFRAGYSKGGPPQYGVIGPELTDDERWAIVEYLKIHKDESAPACEYGWK
jgi:hypothetical protein